MNISEETRRRIVRTLRSEGINWHGNLGEVEFLSRIYDLDKLPSHDCRFEDARGDILQHRVRNYDWTDDWIFDDDRFDLLHCSDDEFLRFLCEMIHPAVRLNKQEDAKLLELFNEELAREGYKIVETKTRFGKIRYEPTGILPHTVDALRQVRDIAEAIDSEYIQREIVRMTVAIEKDPELAIGTAKEFVETMCKTILTARKKPFKGDENLPKLVYLTIEEVKPMGKTQLDPATQKSVRRMLGTLSTLTQCVAELRNLYGTGHGKGVGAAIIDPVYAALAVNAAATLALFLHQLYEKG